MLCPNYGVWVPQLWSRCGAGSGPWPNILDPSRACGCLGLLPRSPACDAASGDMQVRRWPARVVALHDALGVGDAVPDEFRAPEFAL